MEVVGSGSPFHSSEGTLRERLKPMTDAGIVCWRGWVPKSELYERVLPSLDICLLFSPREGAPTAPREAMACGVVPVMSRFLGAHTEELYDHERNCLLFPVGDMSAAARCLQALHLDRKKLFALSTAAAQSITGKQTLAGSLSAWNDALYQIFERPPRVGGRLPDDVARAPGRLQRLGVPAGIAEWTRRVAGRKSRGNCPSDEWPHASGLATPLLVQQIERRASELEGMFQVSEVA